MWYQRRLFAMIRLLRFLDTYLQKIWLKIYAEIDLSINSLFISNFFKINIYIINNFYKISYDIIYIIYLYNYIKIIIKILHILFTIEISWEIDSIKDDFIKSLIKKKHYVIFLIRLLYIKINFNFLNKTI